MLYSMCCCSFVIFKSHYQHWVMSDWNICFLWLSWNKCLHKNVALGDSILFYGAISLLRRMSSPDAISEVILHLGLRQRNVFCRTVGEEYWSLCLFVRSDRNRDEPNIDRSIDQLTWEVLSAIDHHRRSSSTIRHVPKWRQTRPFVENKISLYKEDENLYKWKNQPTRDMHREKKWN